MNVLLLSQFFSVTRGGGEYVFSIIAKKLAENNHRVFVITNRISGEVYHDHKNIQIIFVPPVLEYKGGLPPGFLDNIKYTINAIRKGQEIIKEKKIDIIHSNNFHLLLRVQYYQGSLQDLILLQFTTYFRYVVETIGKNGAPRVMYQS